ncbi:hypothetical protein [Kitasatospora camelliae]|uniref:Uncharacterized protein n=1 Tax=Kitasatospora camelliae TaxID=3156397 RepID=A0AAU8K2P5_9ACTN
MNRTRRPSVPGVLQSTGRALREWPGWFTLAAGAALCVLGWYGVSGENLTARQIPYLASATAPGTALIVAGAVLIAARRPGPSGEGADPRLDQLYALLVTEGTAPGGAPEGTAAGPPVALPEATLYHRPDCPLVAGKADAAPVGAAAARDRGLTPCPVCDPPEPPPAPGGPSPAPGGSPGAGEPRG